MTNSQEALIESSIDLLYLAASDENRWPEALNGLARAFDSPGIAIMKMAPAADSLFKMRALNHDPQVQRIYNDHYWALDPTNSVTRAAPVGEWFDCEPQMNPHLTTQPEYVNDFAIPSGIRWVAGGKVYADDTNCVVLGVQRLPDSRPFDNSAEPVFARISRHIARAFNLSVELRQAQLAKGLSLAALDGIDWPIYAVDSRAQLLLSNRAGECQLRVGSPFGIHGGRLVCGKRDDAGRLMKCSSWRSSLGRVRFAFRTNKHTGC